MKVQNAVHRTGIGLTKGLVGTRLLGMPTLELTTVGRKTGRRRPVMLFAAVVDGETIVVVGSRAGDSVHPAWFLNLRDNPRVEVSLRNGPVRTMLARVATADERAELWPRVVAAWRGYARYQRRTEREIPLVLLSPAPEDG
ncbi:nitroreductase/quinone reductase family protein [Nocardia sp. BMG51109]|uniref:nitroreductase/quinone reductase family protein n=1 Tax=Nocardia sp. BMG51109 TaxID=1056816 RepID=UPI001E3844D7|nr:nitroreductase/quinone reductase family protein [Nocardia sp. BMG51109]